MKKTLLLSSLVMMGALAPAYSAPSLSLKSGVSLETRYKNEKNGEETLEQKVKIGLRVKVGGKLEVVGVVSTGEGFANGHNVLHDFDDDEVDASTSMALNNLYIRTLLSNDLELQLGALETNGSDDSVIDLDDDGAIHGARAIWNSNFGEMSVTAGYIDTVENDVLAVEDHEINYIEITMKKEMFGAMVEAGIEEYEDEIYVKASIQKRLEISANLVVDALLEVMYNTDTEEYKGMIGVEADIMSALTKGKKQGLKAFVNYVFASDEPGDRFGLADSLYADSSEAIVAGLRYELANGWSIQIAHRRDLDEDNDRTDIRFSKKF